MEYFPGLKRCSSATKSKVHCTDWEKHQKISQEEFYFCRCSTTFPVEQKTLKKNVWQMLDSYLCMQRILEKDKCHSSVLVLKKSGILTRTVHKEPGTTLRNRCCWNLQKVDTLFSVQRLHCPRVSSKAKGEERADVQFSVLRLHVQTLCSQPGND